VKIDRANVDASSTEEWRRGGIRTPGRSFGPYNGLANSRFHTLLFGINRLRSEELPYCWAKSHCSAAIVQLESQRFIGPTYVHDERSQWSVS
jgi:hypothetical protein